MYNISIKLSVKMRVRSESKNKITVFSQKVRWKIVHDAWMVCQDQKCHPPGISLKINGSHENVKRESLRLPHT